MPPLDVSAAEQAITALASHLGPVTAYVQAVTGLTLGAQPLLLSGQPVGTFNPLARSPGLSGALQAAQQSCQGFQSNVGDELPFIALLSLCSGSIQGSLEQIQDVLPSGSAVATASAQAALHELVEILSPVNLALSGMAAATDVFLQQLSGDNAALTQGSTAIASALPQIEQWMLSAVIQGYELGVSGLVCQIGLQMIGDLRAISGGLGSALAAAPVLPTALTDFQTVLEITADYYADVSAQLNDASASGVQQILQGLDVKNAEELWNDLITYIDGTGIGGAPASDAARKETCDGRPACDRG